MLLIDVPNIKHTRKLTPMLPERTDFETSATKSKFFENANISKVKKF